MFRKGIVLAALLFFMGMIFTPLTVSNEIEQYSVSTLNDGTLSGYVNDTSMNPIEGAVVMVFFHGTYEKNYTDSSGYYYITNIPICNCTKRVIAYKEGYQGDEVFLSIYENTTYDFVLMSLPPSDLYCWGNLTWIDVHPGDMVNGEIWIMNKGGFDLYWEITEWPEWGSWDFGSYFPKIPPGGLWIVFLNMTAPNQKYETFIGHVKVVNKNNESDYEIIDVSLSTPKNKPFNFNFNLLDLLLDKFPIIQRLLSFPLLNRLLFH